MSVKTWRYLLVVAWLGIQFLLPGRAASAQGESSVILTPPDTRSFPRFTAYLDVHDSSGGFVHGLVPQDITMLEDQVALPVDSLAEKTPGVQFVMAISPGTSLAIRDASGTSRFQYLLQGLLAGNWSSESSGVDDLSLVTAGGPQLLHSSDPSALQSALESYLPGDADDAPSLEVLSSALQVVSDPAPRLGMERAILFITPPQTAGVSLGLQSIIENANQQNIHIFVGLIASPEVFEYPETDLLRNLANQTNGTFFAFSRAEPVPDINTILEPLRYVYQLDYTSQAASAGAHQVAAQVNIGGAQLTSSPQTFNLDLQAPRLEILNPPSQIRREFKTAPTPGSAVTSTDLSPLETLLKIKVSFPDGYTHSLARTSLFVDGQKVAENTAPPFDQFLWDLRPYTSNGTHLIKFEAADALGLVGDTGEISVKITVPSTTQEVVAVVYEKRWWIMGIGVLIASSIFVLVLILGGRIHPKPYPWQVKSPAIFGNRRFLGSSRYRESSPGSSATLSTTGNPDLAMKSPSPLIALFRRLPWFRVNEPPVSVIAYLVPLSATGDPTIPAPLEITVNESSLGSDARLAQLVVVDPSIEGLHSKIHYDGKLFTIADAGSVAGTWVNYDQVTPEGRILAHADIIHLGRVGFRFNLPVPPAQPEVIVTSLEPGQ